MRFLKLDLLTLLISLFLFASCENTSTIGLEVDPTTAIQGNLIDTATIFSRTVKDDAVNTSTLARHPFGYINDPELGSTESSLALSVNIPSESYSFGTAAVLDSAVLVLNFAGEFYGDSTANYSIDVHQLQNNVAKESSYLSSRPARFPAQSLLANYSGKIYPTTPIKVTDVLTGAKDTVMTVTPQIRLKLDNTTITNSIINPDPAIPNKLKYNSIFQEAFKGLRLEINNQTGNGIMFFNFASTTPTTSTSGLVLYYRKQNATTSTERDTVSVNFPVSTSTGPVAARVTHAYSTKVNAQLTPTDPKEQFEVTYLQPLAGLRTKLAFPYLKKMRTEVGKMVVNKAELIIDLKSGTDVAPFRAAPRLALYRFDIAGQRKNLPDNDAGDGITTAGDPRANPTTFGGYFDSVNKRYVFTVTAYVQDLLDGKTEDYGTFLSVTPATAFQFTSPFNTASRAIIGSFKKIPATGNNIMKLNVYYTKVN
ncbi:hypothetical protein D3C87_177900 [compost metagenome]